MNPATLRQRTKDRAATAFPNFRHACTHMLTVLCATAVPTLATESPQ